MQTRAKLAATAKAAAAARDTFTWNTDAVARLRQAYRTGGNAAAHAAFPDLRYGQVHAALQRYCMVQGISPMERDRAQPVASCWNDPAFNRRFMEALTGIRQL